jgi:tetratricopeptide (TPR) repeat protein
VTDITQIEKYLADELNQDELQAFNKRLQTDGVFAETFALYKSIDGEMNETEDEVALRERLSGLTQKHFTIPQPAKIIPIASRRKWWLYAVAAAASIAIVLFLMPGNEKPLSNEQLFAQYAVPEDLPTVVRGANDDSLLLKATSLFNQKMYAAAKILLDSIAKSRPTEAKLQLSLGICYLKTGEFNFAIDNFNSLANGESIYKYDAIAWKAYTLLKQDKREACIVVLKQIPANAANYEKANELIGKLSKK